jgi:hypothetical protein
VVEVQEEALELAEASVVQRVELDAVAAGRARDLRGEPLDQAVGVLELSAARSALPVDGPVPTSTRTPSRSTLFPLLSTVSCWGWAGKRFRYCS